MADETRPNEFPHLPYSLEGHFQPWYDDRRDYNTNAPTYYDYLANINSLPASEVELINRVAKRNFTVKNPNNCFTLTKKGDWISEGDKGDNGQSSWHYNVELEGNVNLETDPEAQDFNAKHYELPNAITCKDGGLYAPQYRPILESMQEDLNTLGKHHTDYVTYNDKKIFQLTTEMEELKNKYLEMTTKYTILVTAVQKFVDNLNYNGNATTNNIETFEIVDGIACGNINVWTGQAGGGSLIRTHNGVHENDVTIGHI